MNKTIRELFEKRDALVTQLDEVLEPLTRESEDEKRDLTPEEETRSNELTGEIEALDERIKEEDAKAQRSAEINSARLRMEENLRSTGTSAEVVDEPKVYGEGSPNSYFADLIRSSNPSWAGHKAAVERMSKYESQVATEVVLGTKEGRRVEDSIKQTRRDAGRTGVEESLAELRSLGNAGAANGAETRAMSAASNSGGSFVTPVYLVQDWAPYRLPGRAFIDACNKQIMPDYGMQILIPAVQSNVGVGLQETAAGVNENSLVTETDPTSGYLSANLQTEAGQITVSQQLLDRAGPNFAFDRMLFDQLTREYNRQVDIFTLLAALSGAGSVAFTNAGAYFQLTGQSTGAGGGGEAGASGATTGNFLNAVTTAKAKVRTAAGVVMDPTHLFVHPETLEQMEASVDTTGRPLMVPNYAGPYNAAVAGSSDGRTGFEGDSGYRFGALPTFQDLNIPAVGGNGTAIVGALEEVYVWESTPTPRVLPQTYGQNLSVLLQLYGYIAVIPRYPTAVQAISGSGLNH